MDTPSRSADAKREDVPAREPDAFDILHLEPQFALDPELLTERHRTLSLALHPDRFAGRPSAERRLSLEQAMRVNAAFRTLKDPVTRAEVLARRLDLPLAEEVSMSLELLERTMERRETLAEAVLAGDHERIAALAREGRREQVEHCARLTAIFAESPGPGQAALLGEIVSGLRFLRRFVDSAEAELDAHQA